MSSCGASCCTCFRSASCASATSACSPIVIVPRNSLRLALHCNNRRPNRSSPKRLSTSCAVCAASTSRAAHTAAKAGCTSSLSPLLHGASRGSRPDRLDETPRPRRSAHSRGSCGRHSLVNTGKSGRPCWTRSVGPRTGYVTTPLTAGRSPHKLRAAVAPLRHALIESPSASPSNQRFSSTRFIGHAAA